MATENQTSGNTTQAIYQDAPQEQFFYIKDIFDESYDPDMDTLLVECMTGNGEIINLNIQARHIKRFGLALHKGEAEKKYFDYISKYY